MLLPAIYHIYTPKLDHVTCDSGPAGAEHENAVWGEGSFEKRSKSPLVTVLIEETRVFVVGCQQDQLLAAASRNQSLVMEEHINLPPVKNYHFHNKFTHDVYLRMGLFCSWAKPACWIVAACVLSFSS